MIKLVDFYCVKGARQEFEKAALHFISHASPKKEAHVLCVLNLLTDAASACSGIECVLKAAL
jgi:hypothetical protein